MAKTIVPDRGDDPKRKFVATQRTDWTTGKPDGIHVEATNDRNDVGGAYYQTDSKEKAIQLHSDRIKKMAFVPRNKQRRSKGRNYL
jgi:hypothetical protein